jgi:hypothetical protein
MKKIRHFLRWPRPAKHLAVETALLLWAVRVALWLVPFKWIHRLITRYNRLKADHGEESLEIARIIPMVVAISRYVPRATCLAQAITAQILLARRHVATTLQIGVAKPDSSDILRAHAWLEYHNRVILGQIGDLAGYARLPVLLSQRPANLTKPTRKPNP